jgi:hypothetical protein
MNKELRGKERKSFMPRPRSFLGPRSRERRLQHSKMTDEAWKERIVADSTLPVEAPEGYVFNAKIQEELASIPPEGVAVVRKDNAPPPPIKEYGAIAVPEHIYSNGIRWNVGNMIGGGAQGKVFEISHDGTEKKKRIVKLMTANTEYERKNLWNEVGVSMATGDFVGSEVINDEKDGIWAAIVMERHDGKDGKKLTKENDKEHPPAHKVKDVYKFAVALRSMVSQLRLLHSAGWIHQDVKPANTIFNLEDGEESLSRIVDLGIAERSGNVRDHRKGSAVGTPVYMIPESWWESDADVRVRDYWATMVTIAEVSGFIGRKKIRTSGVRGIREIMNLLANGDFFIAPKLSNTESAKAYFDANNIEGAHKEFLMWIYNFLQPHMPAVGRLKLWKDMGVTQTLTKQVKTKGGVMKDITGDFLNDGKFVKELERHVRGLAKQAGLEVPEETLALLQEFPKTEVK